MIKSLITLLAVTLVSGAAMADDKDAVTFFHDVGVGAWHHVIKPTKDTTVTVAVKVKDGAVTAGQYTYKTYLKPVAQNLYKGVVEAIKLPATGAYNIFIQPLSLGCYHGAKEGGDVASCVKQVGADSAEGAQNTYSELKDDAAAVGEHFDNALNVTVVPVAKAVGTAAKASYVALCKAAGGCVAKRYN